jgi:hypothetical protein
MKINQNDWMLLVCIVLDLVILVDKHAITRAVHRADVAEHELASCLNKHPIIGDVKEMDMYPKDEYGSCSVTHRMMPLPEGPHENQR